MSITTNPWDPTGSLGIDWSQPWSSAPAPTPNDRQDHGQNLEGEEQGHNSKSYLLPRPTSVEQKTDTTCWAAALASLIQSTSSNRSNWTETSLCTEDAVIERVKRIEKQRGVKLLTRVSDGDKWDNSLVTTYPNLPEVGEVMTSLNLPRPTAQGDAAVFAAVKSLVERDYYVLLSRTEPSWGDAWHDWIIYGFSLAPGAQTVHCMDPASGKYVTIALPGSGTSYFYTSAQDGHSYPGMNE